MIRNSFVFLEKITPKTEAYFHSCGIKSWDDFLNSKKIEGISDERKKYYDRRILEAKHNLYSLNSSYFKSNLPSTESWRLYNFFKEDIAFLDIETTGLDSSSYITMVGIFDGFETKPFVKGINLTSDLLKKELSKYKLIVTFNGSTFDLPMINKKFPGVIPKDLPHWDLRHGCAKVGLTGGLKKIEKDLGIKRSNPIVEGMYGGDAVTLWRMYHGSGNDYYLNLLIEYNEEDCINLKSIANKVYSKLSNNLISSSKLTSDNKLTSNIAHF